MVEILLAMVAGLLLGLGSVGLARLVGNVKEMLGVLGFLELWAPLTGLVDYAAKAVMADPINGMVGVGYALAGYLLYATFWGFGAMLGSMMEHITEEAGYMAGRTLSTMW